MIAMQPRSRSQSFIELTAAVGLPAMAAVLLHRLGAHPRLQVPWSDLELWLQTAPPDDVAAALLRVVGLAAAYWVTGTTALYLLARLTRVPAAIHAVEWATLPTVRRAADRAVAVALVGSTLSGHAGAALAAEADELPGVPPPPVVQLDDAVDAAEGAREDREPVSVPAPTDGLPGVGPDAPADDAPRSPAPPRSLPSDGIEVDASDLDGAEVDDRAREERAADQADQRPGDTSSAQPNRYEVVAGDNLWRIAEDTLATAWARKPSAAEISLYWWELIDENLDRLRSGDPDLIYPGEMLHLPATPEEAGRD